MSKAVARREPKPEAAAFGEPGLLGVVKRACWRVIGRKSGWDGDVDTLAREIVRDLQSHYATTDDALARIAAIVAAARR